MKTTKAILAAKTQNAKFMEGMFTSHGWVDASYSQSPGRQHVNTQVVRQHGHESLMHRAKLTAIITCNQAARKTA